MNPLITKSNADGVELVCSGKENGLLIDRVVRRGFLAHPDTGEVRHCTVRVMWFALQHYSIIAEHESHTDETWGWLEILQGKLTREELLDFFERNVLHVSQDRFKQQ